MDITVIICTHNRAVALERTIRCFDAQDMAPSGDTWEVLVVDNNSSDDTRAVVESLQAAKRPWLGYAFEPTQGKSFALNRGVRQASGRIVAFTDDDVLVDPGWIAAVRDAFADSDLAGIGGRILAEWTSQAPGWLKQTGPHRLMLANPAFDRGNETFLLSTDTPPLGANMAFRRDVFDRHGLFRTDLGPVGMRGLRGEDSDFAFRVMQAGEAVAYVPAAVVHHPVERDRVTKRYYRHWYLDHGRSEIRQSPPPQLVGRILGVPQHLIREFLEGSLRWVRSALTPHCFYYELRLWLTAGRIRESRHRWKHGSSSAESEATRPDG